MNLNFRTNESPETLLKELVLSPLIYVRLLGLVSLIGACVLTVPASYTVGGKGFLLVIHNEWLGSSGWEWCGLIGTIDV